MAKTPKQGNRDDSDANPGRTGPTGGTDEITRLGNTPGGGSSGAAECGGRGGITGAAGGYLSGGPDTDAAGSPIGGQGGETTETDALPSELAEPSNKSRVIGGSVAHPYGEDPTGGRGGRQP
jgi:hypothetical protein